MRPPVFLLFCKIYSLYFKLYMLLYILYNYVQLQIGERDGS